MISPPAKSRDSSGGKVALWATLRRSAVTTPTSPRSRRSKVSNQAICRSIQTVRYRTTAFTDALTTLTTIDSSLRTPSQTTSITASTDIVQTTTCTHQRTPNTTSQAATTSTTKTIRNLAAVQRSVWTTPSASWTDVCVEHSTNALDLNVQGSDFLFRAETASLEVESSLTILRINLIKTC